MTDELSGTGDALLKLAGRLRENQIFGTPVARGGVTVVPVAKIQAGGGLGAARERSHHQAKGGGFGFVARPVGAWVVEDSGRVRWRPALDVTRVGLGAQILVALLVIGNMLRRRLQGVNHSGQPLVEELFNRPGGPGRR